MANEQEILNSNFVVACQENDFKRAKQLLEKGADVNAMDEFTNRPALAEVVFNENKDILNLLIQNGADVNKRESSSGKTPLMYAVMLHYSRLDCEKRKEISKILIQNGADIEARDHAGRTVLMLALEYSYGKEDMIGLLLEHGADMHSKLIFGKEVVTPLSIAKKMPYKNITALFETKPAQIVSSKKNVMAPKKMHENEKS